MTTREKFLEKPEHPCYGPLHWDGKSPSTFHCQSCAFETPIMKYFPNDREGWLMVPVDIDDAEHLAMAYSAAEPGIGSPRGRVGAAILRALGRS